MTTPTSLTRPLYGYRFVDTLYGDSLQSIAAREMGDPSRWTDLIAYNGLVPPFITDDPALAGPGVIRTGQAILVPAPAPVINTTSDPNAVLGTDIQLGQRGELMTDGTDFMTVSGADNIEQALGCRIRTGLGDLLWHPGYGCDARRVVGAVNGPTKGLLTAQICKASVTQDPRVNRVTSASAVVAGDDINVTVVAETIAGRSVSTSAAV